MEAIRQIRPDLDDPTAIAQFVAGLHGSALQPGDPGYDDAHLVHSMRADGRRPALVVRACDSADVVRTVDLARETGRSLSVRSGGHSLAAHGTNDDGIVLDLRDMKGLHIDPDARAAWAQPGLTAGEYSRAVAAHGLATPFGDTASVGISGLTLGGGIGYLARKYGLAIDALQAVEMVTADGRQVIADEYSHPDLFWAVRGGGGNFGVVTRFKYHLYPVDQVYGGALVLPATRETLRALEPIAARAPEALTTISFVMHAPPAPFIPADRVGELALMITFVWSGDPADGPAAVQPFRDLAEPIADLTGPMAYPEIYRFTEAAEARMLAIHRSRFLDHIGDDVVEAILTAMAEPASPRAMIQLRVLGGAMAEVAPEATAFAHRTAAVMALIIDVFDDPTSEPVQQAWTESLDAAFAPHEAGVYVNFLEAEGESRIRAAYPNGTYERLAAIKRRYDPSNLFDQNQNIRPALAMG